jgi:hypothetical protein
MKKMIFVLLILFFSLGSTTEGRNFYYGGGITFNYFYRSLEPYGEWIQIDNDLIVWHPRVVQFDWSPYSVGRWVWTDYGWYWDSFEPFGWATYHYGRWIYDDYYGWVWVPSYRWGPAWVEWRYNDDYIGWAPLPPYASFDVHIGIHFSFGWRASINYWHFVTYRRFCGFNVSHYLVNYDRVESFFPRTRYRTNYDYRNGRIVNYGVDRNYVQRRSGIRIRKANLRVTSSRTVLQKNSLRSRNVVTVFRPNKQEVSKVSKIRKFNVKRAERTSIATDRIAVGRVRNTNVVKRERINTNSRTAVKKRQTFSPEKGNRIYYKRQLPRLNRQHKEMTRKSVRSYRLPRNRKTEKIEKSGNRTNDRETFSHGRTSSYSRNSNRRAIPQHRASRRRERTRR